jgi:hypothetical protein
MGFLGFRSAQQTGQKLLEALGLQGQHVASLSIHVTPDELLKVDIEVWPDAEQLDELENAIETEFQQYMLMPITPNED